MQARHNFYLKCLNGTSNESNPTIFIKSILILTIGKEDLILKLSINSIEFLVIELITRESGFISFI